MFSLISILFLSLFHVSKNLFRKLTFNTFVHEFYTILKSDFLSLNWFHRLTRLHKLFLCKNIHQICSYTFAIKFFKVLNFETFVTSQKYSFDQLGNFVTQNWLIALN